MSYGKWKALHYVPPVVVIPQEEEPEVKEETPKQVCRYCGKAFKGHKNRRYCSDDCKYEVQKAAQKERYHIKTERMMENGKV